MPPGGSLPGPVFFPVRALAVVYAELSRGIPTILVIAEERTRQFLQRIVAAGRL